MEPASRKSNHLRLETLIYCLQSFHHHLSETEFYRAIDCFVLAKIQICVEQQDIRPCESIVH